MNSKELKPNYPDHDTWTLLGKQMFELWVQGGEDENDPCPQIPILEKLFEPSQDDIMELNDKWADTTAWLKRNDCRIQNNKKVVRLPAPKKKPLAVNAEDPYACDALERNKKTGAFLTQLIRIQSEPFVLAVDGSWGSGKTALFNMWEHDLRRHFDVISFNAWESDFATDPLVALAAEVNEQFKGKLDPQRFTDLFKIGGNLILKLLSQGACSVNDLNAEELKAKEEQTINDWFRLYRSQKELTRAFRTQLENIAKEAKGGKLVFLIDELDRCRPTYAIEFMERIKHLFMAPGVCFALALDRQQLGKSIQAVYGNINTEGYLRRFIDLSYKLPSPQTEMFIGLLFKEQHLENYLNNRAVQDGAAEWMKRILAYLASTFRFNLRDVEHIVRQLVLAARTTPENRLLSPVVLSVLACIKLYNESMYYEFCEGNASATSMLEQLPSLPGDENIQGVRVSMIIEATLRFADKTITPENWRSNVNSGNPTGIGKEDMLKIIDRIRDWHETYTMTETQISEWVFQKLELTHDLVG